MDRNEVLGEEGGEDEEPVEGPLHAARDGSRVGARLLRYPLGEDLDHSGPRQGDGESADHDVGEADLRADEEVVVESGEGALHAEAGVESAEEPGCEKRDGDGDLDEAERDHRDDREDDRVHAVAGEVEGEGDEGDPADREDRGEGEDLSPRDSCGRGGGVGRHERLLCWGTPMVSTG